MLTTTLNEILKYSPCQSGWDKLTGQGLDNSLWVGNDDLLGFDKILESNGLDDAIWACRVLKGEDLKRFKLWVCDIAERALIYVPEGEDRPRVAIETARKYIKGECSKGELNIATRAATRAARAATDIANAAFYAAFYAACSTVGAAIYAADAAIYATTAAAYDAEREIQKEMFIKLINE